jgi:hypothetical protein
MAWIPAVIAGAGAVGGYRARRKAGKAAKALSQQGMAEQRQRRDQYFADLNAGVNKYDPAARAAARDQAAAAARTQMDADLAGAPGAASAPADPAESSDAAAYRARIASREGDRIGSILANLAQIQAPNTMLTDEGFAMADLTNRLGSQLGGMRGMARAYGESVDNTLERGERKAAGWDLASRLGMSAMGRGFGGRGGRIVGNAADGTGITGSGKVIF